MKKNISISTGGYNNLTGFNAIKFLKKNKITSIELSGGKYSKNQIKNILSLRKKLTLRVHNYFPPQKIPFVINLASDNKKILNRSIAHIKKSIRLVKKLGSGTYSFHAGFRLDPSVKSLGKKFEKTRMISKQKAFRNFVRETLKISKYAKKNKVNIMIENNVLTKKNLKRFRSNPFLLTNYSDVKNFFRRMPKNVKLLIDVAHLKVSAKTEKNNLIKSLKIMNKYVGGYHFSDNNGYVDSNKSFKKNAWFLPYIRKNLDYYSIEVYRQTPNKLKNQINILKKKLS